MAMLMQFPVLLKAKIGMLHYGIIPGFNSIKWHSSPTHTGMRSHDYSYGLI